MKQNDINGAVILCNFEEENGEKFRFANEYELDENGAIDFTALIKLKYKEGLAGKKVALLLIKKEGIDEKTGKIKCATAVADIYTLMGEVNGKSDNKGYNIKDDVDYFLDGYDNRMMVRFNAKNIPTKGEGSYAIVLNFLEDESVDPRDKRNVLDIEYFGVKNPNNCNKA